MPKPREHDELRDPAEQLVLGLADVCTHRNLDATCVELGLPVLAEEPAETSGGAPGLTKRQRLQQSFDLLDSCHYPDVLTRFLERGLPPPLRNRVQDLLWAREQWPEITERVRRDVADGLEQVVPIWESPDGFMELVHRLWVLETDLDLWTGHSLADEIQRHVIRNPDDWTVRELVRQVGALRCSDRRFELFIEGLLSGSVNPNEERQRAMAEAITPALSRAGVKIIQSGTSGGYPDFSIVRTGTRARPPQLILFGSTSAKPDLRLSEVLDQQVEVINGTSDVLRYDRPIPEHGLTWDQLQAWWAEREHVAVEEAKRSLWRRLRIAIPRASPPQLALFDQYHEIHGQRGAFPALLPEVWLHWDPVAKIVRGDDAMLTQRMDFVMLLPGHRRVVLEVDGHQHYSKDGQPSPATYAQTTRGDRDLRLSGYEVYRFSGYELTPARARTTVSEFFGRLLGKAM